MQHLDSRKLKSAMIDAAILRAERTMKDDQEPVVVHPLYRERWERTVRELQVRRLRKKRKTRVLAFIIAAVVAALAGCAWTYREKIADFWVTAFDKYDKLEIDDIGEDFPRTIEEVYIPTYVPEGYELEYEQIGVFQVNMTWKNNDDYIIYSQTVLSKSENVGNPKILDNEVGEYKSKKWNDCIVFYYFHDERQYYVWTDKYKFYLIFSKEISDNNFEKIIKNIEKNEEKAPREDFIIREGS